MDAGDLLARFRLDVRDTIAPYMWSDAEIYAYIDEAQREFCRRTGGIADASSPVAQLNVLTGDSFAALNPLVLKVRAAFDATGKKLQVFNFEDLEFSDSNGLELYGDTAGKVLTLVLGMENNKVKLIHTPEADQTLSMIVYRLPLETINATSSELEIDAQHHEALLYWARRLGHMKADAEAYDRGRADQFEKQFIAYCAMAADEKGRREHKHRGVMFSW